MAYVTHRGVRFHVQQLGRSRGGPDHAGGPSPRLPVVMVHGLLTASCASWYFTCGPALARGRVVFTYDLRGHGLSDRPRSGYSSVTHAEDLDLLTAELGPFVLVGHSFGSLVATRFALAHPERVRGLALIEPPILTHDGAAWWSRPPERCGAVPPSVDGRQATAGIGGIDTQLLGPLVRRGEDRGCSRRPAIERITSLTRDTTVLADLAHELPVTDTELTQLVDPLLVVLGNRSTAAAVAPRVTRVRGAASVVLLDAGHAVHVDARDELTRLLDRLADQAGSSHTHTHTGHHQASYGVRATTRPGVGEGTSEGTSEGDGASRGTGDGTGGGNSASGTCTAAFSVTDEPAGDEVAYG